MEQAEQLAINKAKEIYNENVGIEYAIDLNKIAAKYKILLQEANDDFLQKIVEAFSSKFFANISGLFISGPLLENENDIILVNKTDSPSEQRFTIAHELGHYFLKHTDNKNVVSLKLRSPNNFEHCASMEERVANIFATELLMPSEQINSYVKRNNLADRYNKINLECLLDISNRFAVSNDAMKKRLQLLGYRLW